MHGEPLPCVEITLEVLMKVYSRPLNQGEKFCVSIKAAKDTFQNTEIKLCFGEFRRHYVPYPNEIGYSYYKKNIKGVVVAGMVIHPGVHDPLLSFYVVKAETVSDILQSRFEKDVLPQLLDIYTQSLPCDKEYSKPFVVSVELLNNEFIIHRYT